MDPIGSMLGGERGGESEMPLERDWQQHDVGLVLRVVPGEDRRGRRRSDLAAWGFVVALAAAVVVLLSDSLGPGALVRAPRAVRGGQSPALSAS
jgi:hypothetical protein